MHVSQSTARATPPGVWAEAVPARLDGRGVALSCCGRVASRWRGVWRATVARAHHDPELPRPDELPRLDRPEDEEPLDEGLGRRGMVRV